jgi:hypothetical protein
MLNGNLLVRTGGGHQDLLDALGKLPLSAADGSRVSASSSRPSSGSSSASRSSGNSSHDDEVAVGEGELGADAQEDEEDEFCCYTTLTVEAAAAATASAGGASEAGQGQLQHEQQQQQEEGEELQDGHAAAGVDAEEGAAELEGTHSAEHGEVVAVVKISGESSAVALQCLAELGSTGGAGDAAWMAMVAEATASASKLTGYTSEQVLAAAASELASQ